MVRQVAAVHFLLKRSVEYMLLDETGFGIGLELPLGRGKLKSYVASPVASMTVRGSSDSHAVSGITLHRSRGTIKGGI